MIMATTNASLDSSSAAHKACVGGSHYGVRPLRVVYVTLVVAIMVWGLPVLCTLR